MHFDHRNIGTLPLVWDNLRNSIFFLAAIASCWGLVTNIYGILDPISKRWPFLFEWLQIIGIVGIVFYVVAFAVYLILIIVTRVRSRRSNERQIEGNSVKNRLRQIQRLLNLFPDESDVAKANVIIARLIGDGVLNPSINKIPLEELLVYISYVLSIVEQFGLNEAKVNSDKIFSDFMSRQRS